MCEAKNVFIYKEQINTKGKETDMENKKDIIKTETTEDVLAEYVSQDENDDVHFEHVDWVYSDGSDCCC